MPQMKKPWEADYETGPGDAKKAFNETDPLLPGKEKETGIGSVFDVGFVDWMTILSHHFGYKLLCLLFVVQHLLKGFANSFMAMGEPYLFKSYGVPAPRMQVYQGVTGLPWAMKPIIGLVSDIFPIFGYNKAPYMFLVSALGALACLAIGCIEQEELSVTMLVICLFLFTMQISATDLLSEAKYAEKMRACPKYGPDLLTYVWFGLQVGSLVAVALSGLVIMRYGPKMLFVWCAVPAMLVFIPVMCGYMEEKVVTPEEIREARQRFYAQKEACFLCVLIFAGVLLLTYCGIRYHDPYTNAMVSIAVAITMLVSFTLVLRPIIAKFNAFSLIQTSLSLSTSGAAFYFYTDNEEQYPEGPHFSEFFYNSVMGTVGALFSLVGIWLYQRYMSSWRYRELLIFTNVVYAILSLLDVIMFSRLNVKWGIPDHMFVLSAAVLQHVIWQWKWMPQVVILSYLCPKGMEATMYALLAGCHNLGNTIASSCGALLLERLGVDPRGAPNEGHKFKNLWVASAVSTVLPLVTILLLFWLIPDARQKERLIDEDDHDATAGSLLHRLQHRPLP